MTQTASPAAATSAPLPLSRRADSRVFNMVTPLVDRHVSEGRGGRVAIQQDDRAYTYAELQALVNQVGNALRAAGVEQEQRVALLLPDGVEFVATFLGAMKIGAVPVPLNTLATLEDLVYFLDNSRARVLVSTAALVGPLADSGHADLGDLLLRTVLLVGGGREDLGPLGRATVFEPAVASASDQLETFPTGVDEPSYWLYSSGTTGRPKGTVHLHGDMLACVAPYAEEVLQVNPDDRFFSVARLFFSYGLVNSLYLPLLNGATSVLTPDRPDPATILRIMRVHRPTLLFSVPTSYVQLCAALEKGENADRPFKSLRYSVAAGEPLPAPLYQRWRDLTGVELLDGIGSSEVGYIFCSNKPGQVRAGSSGQMLGDHQARIVDENGADVLAGEEGELWVKSESVALLYWNQRERTKATFAGEWLRTGDRYRRDEDGYYWYLGRTSDVFKVSGQWVWPTDVESCLMEHPSVLECAVVGIPDETGLVKPKAFVVRRPGLEVSAADLQVHVKARILPHKYPRWVEFVNELPKTATGKVQRFKLRGE